MIKQAVWKTSWLSPSSHHSTFHGKVKVFRTQPEELGEGRDFNAFLVGKKRWKRGAWTRISLPFRWFGTYFAACYSLEAVCLLQLVQRAGNELDWSLCSYRTLRQVADTSFDGCQVYTHKVLWGVGKQLLSRLALVAVVYTIFTVVLTNWLQEATRVLRNFSCRYIHPRIPHHFLILFDSFC